MFKLKELKYDYDALAPFISKEALEVHHLGHHKAYTDNFNDAIEQENAEGKSCEEIFADIKSYSIFLKNNAGGY